MTARVLPKSEWCRLAGTEADLPLPESAIVVVVEQGNEIVGCQVLVQILHAECLWIHPDHRGKAGVARRLWTAVKAMVRLHFGVTHFATNAISDDVRRLLEHVGAQRVPGDTYMVPIGGK